MLSLQQMTQFLSNDTSESVRGVWLALLLTLAPVLAGAAKVIVPPLSNLIGKWINVRIRKMEYAQPVKPEEFTFDIPKTGVTFTVDKKVDITTTFLLTAGVVSFTALILAILSYRRK